MPHLSLFIIGHKAKFVAVVQSLSHVQLFCHPKDYSPPASSVYRISQAGIWEWVANSISRASSWPRYWTRVSCISRWILYHWDYTTNDSIPLHLGNPRLNYYISTILWWSPELWILQQGFHSIPFWALFQFLPAGGGLGQKAACKCVGEVSRFPYPLG